MALTHFAMGHVPPWPWWSPKHHQQRCSKLHGVCTHPSHLFQAKHRGLFAGDILFAPAGTLPAGPFVVLEPLAPFAPLPCALPPAFWRWASLMARSGGGAPALAASRMALTSAFFFFLAALAFSLLACCFADLAEGPGWWVEPPSPPSALFCPRPLGRLS